MSCFFVQLGGVPVYSPWVNIETGEYSIPIDSRDQSPADAPAEANGRVRSRDGNLGVSFPSLEEAVGMDGPTKLLVSCTQSCTKWWG